MLWDTEFRPRREDFDRVREDRRHGLAVTAIDRTLAELTPPLGEGRGAELFRRTFGIVRTADPAAVSLPDDTVAELTTFLSDHSENAVGPLLMAVVTFLGVPGEGMSGEALFTIFSHCYEAVHEREQTTGGPLDTDEEERANPRLAAVVAWQKELLGQS
jgi:hypothetical protein